MNSEKVKEIKKALKNNANYEHHDKLGYIDGYKCKTVAFADILTLINDFESENERLSKELDVAEKIWNMAKLTVDITKHIVQGREYLHLDALKEIIKSCGVEIKE